MKTVSDLLNTEEFRHNQTGLAIALNVNRGTLRKYMEDLDGENHEVREFKGKRQLMTLNTLAVRGKR